MTQHWQDVTETILKPWLAKNRRGLITDVDGTISPIVNQADAAQVTPHSKELLRDLDGKLEFVGVISGRAAADVQARVGLPELVYAGNHGLERWVAGTVQVVPQARQYRPALEKMLLGLHKFQHDLPGVVLEDKGVTLSIHYRNAAPGAAATMRPTIEQLARHNALRVFEGRMVFEIRPPLEMNKGSAFRDLVTENTLDAALYIGDDTTDVDAIKAARALREAGTCYAFGVGVLAEETPSSVLEAADFLVEGVPGVESFLDWLSNAASASRS